MCSRSMNIVPTFSPPRQSLAYVLPIIALAVLLAALWHVLSLLVLAFGAVVAALFIRALADPLRSALDIDDAIAVTLSILTMVIGIGMVGWLFGAQISAQFSVFANNLPGAWDRAQVWIASWPGGDIFLRDLTRMGAGDGLLAHVAGAFTSMAGALADTALVLVGGVFLAANPTLYRSGFTMLAPKAHRPLFKSAIEDCGRALKLWLNGQLMVAAFVGTVTGLALWAIGVPAPLALGIITGVTNLIPFVGAILAAIPVLLLAAVGGFEVFLWALLAIVTIQQIEGNFLTPLVQQRAVNLPPFVEVFGVVAATMLFGIPGLIFAGPLVVATYVLVKRIYVEEVLDTPTFIPGRTSEAPMAVPAE